jgi:hypothetical protein
MNSKQKMEEELYNINDYTDEEIYEILDLLNPTDRELEAKIIFLIQKYENIGTESSIKISQFFEDVYKHFFDTDEGYEEQNNIEDNTTEGYENINTTYSDNANQNYISNDFKASNENTNASGNTVQSENTISNEKRNENVVFTTNLEYTKDPLNPLLKQTTTRIISIDSQYRDDKSTLTTDFSCELSEPLKDVVSMKLYSFQIPYTWYTIGQSYGCNFFYLKAITNGLNNDNHDISFSINPGNYTPNELATAVQNSIVNARTIYTDVSFATTNISYNSNTSLSSLSIDINNQFSENGYYMNFPYFTSPYRNDSLRNDSIPAFLGFETTTYYTNSIKSTYSLPLKIEPNNDDSNDPDNLKIFMVDNSNNYFTVIKYIGVDEYNIDSIVDISFNIYFTSNLKVPGKYSRNKLLTDISNAIYNCQYLDNTYNIGSSIIRKNIDLRNNFIDPSRNIIDPSRNLVAPDNPIPPDSSNNIYVNIPNNSYYELKLKPNRYTTKNIVNSKMIVQFPDETLDIYNIWTGSTSCFRFDSSYTELNTIYAEYPLIKEPQIFLIDNSAQIFLKCTAEKFNLPINDISINIPPKISDIDNISPIAYSDLTEYINAINIGINSISNNQNFTVNDTEAKIDEKEYFDLHLDIEKTFDQTMYEMDLTNTIFNSNNIRITDTIGNTILTDLSQNYTTKVNAGAITVSADTLLAVIYPKPNTNYGNQNDVTYNLTFGESRTFTDYIFFENAVNQKFQNYIDPLSGRTIFAGTNLSHIVTQNVYQVTLTIRIAKKLVAKNYNIEFIDKTNNSWRNYLFIDQSMFNKSYDISGAYIRADENKKIFNDSKDIIATIDKTTNEITIKGITPIKSYLFDISGQNSLISFIAYEDGIKDTTSINDLSGNNLSIDLSKDSSGNSVSGYTINGMITRINTEFNNSLYFKGSKISTFYIGNYQYLKLRMNVNRVYTASDYSLVFYDEISFIKCFVGASSVQNTTWDATLGWILGFRNYTTYALNDFLSKNDIAIIIGDTGVCTNLYNYFLLCLDDYNQNHLNDGLVTIANKETSIRLPSYANPSNRTCDPVTGQLTYNTSVSTDNKKLTANQIYSLTEIANSQYSTETTGSSIRSKSYGNSPSAKDVIAILPMKVAGLQNGASYMEFGGTLQNQGRSYFGPVNIRKFAISLLSDRGNKVDLNNANWSFSLVVESLNKLRPTK